MMNGLLKKSLSCLALGCTFATVPVAQAADAPAMVLVHGAHFTATAWERVQAQLGDRIDSHAIDLPGRNDHFLPEKVSLELSAASLCSFMSTIPGDKVVVAHSQGGAVVNASLSLCPDENISKLVYVTAVAPLNGEGVFSKLSKADETHYFAGVSFNEKTMRMDISNPDNFASSFAQDANAEQQQWLKQQAVAEPAGIGEGTIDLNRERFEALDKYYVFAKRDQIISLESQQRTAGDLDLAASFEIDSGHLPMLTHSKALADLLVQISER